jgi:hypothetical protein
MRTQWLIVVSTIIPLGQQAAMSLNFAQALKIELGQRAKALRD